MGIFDALTSAVTGLQAQSFALQNISGNIANSQTTGYKETDTSFQDLVSAAAAGQQTAGGVIAGSVATNTVQGAIQSTSVSTDMAINGDGFFVVAKPTGFTDNQPVFNGVSDYTRAGNFQIERQRQSGQRRRLLSHGHPGQRDDRQSRRQRPSGSAVPQQFRAGAGNDANSISGEPSKLACRRCSIKPASRRIRSPARRSAVAGATLLPDALATGTGHGRHAHQRHGADQRRRLYGERRHQYDELHRGRDLHARPI